MHLEQHILFIHLKGISKFYQVQLHICRQRQAPEEDHTLAHPLGAQPGLFMKCLQAFSIDSNGTLNEETI